jgi:hypothetical protein
MSDWFNTYDGVFFLGIATLLFGCLGLVVRTAYRSKCKDCSICFGLIKITRDTEGEIKEDIELGKTEETDEKNNK